MKKIKTTKKSILISVLILAIVAAGVFYFFKTNEKNNSKTQSDSSNQGINYSPPTEEETKAGDEIKESIVKNEEAKKSANSSGDIKAVLPVITYAGQFGQNIEVGGYIPNVFERDGTCTAIFTLNTATLSRSVKAVENANSVDCPTISISSSEFPNKGTWSLVLNYTSSSSKGGSSPMIVEVK